MKFASLLTLSGLAILAAVAPASGFTVIKNINTGKPPVEKVVLFEKGQAADTVTFFDTESGRMSLTPDGELELKISGNGEVKSGLNWKPRGDLKETFDTKDYGSVVITCRMEGSTKTTNPNGSVSEQRPDNLWFPMSLFNEKGEPVGSANLADGADGKTPSETTTVVLPMLLFTYFGDHDSSQVRGVGFTWAPTRPNLNRDYRLVIERIALAE